jgi:hypothetical protein
VTVHQSPSPATHQRELFPEAADPVLGIEVELPDACPQCSTALASIGPGREPHKASLRCCQCGRHRGWVSLISFTFISEAVRLAGKPDTPIKIRRGVWQPPNGAASLERKREENQSTCNVTPNTDEKADREEKHQQNQSPRHMTPGRPFDDPLGL